MSKLKARRFVAVLASCASMVGCGGHPTAPASARYAGLNGNWNMVAVGAVGTVPQFSASLVVSGDTVTAVGNLQAGCPPPNAPGYLGSFGGSGTVAADGTFQAAPQGAIPVNANVIVLSGSVPASGAASWTGTYSVSREGGSGCQGTFIATAFPVLNATYSGQLLTSGVAKPSGITLALALSQGASQILQTSTGTSGYLPLTGTVSVSGVACFAHGTIQLPYESYVGGSLVAVVLTMDHGSQMNVSGTLDSTDEMSVNLIAVSVSGGKCNGSYGGTLQRQ